MMNELRERGVKMMEIMMPDTARDLESHVRDGEFGAELVALSLDNVFGNLWSRPELDLRSRSLVTLGILIALRASEQLKNHFEIAQRLGLTRVELEEVVYHASGYAGFPAAAAAQLVASGVFSQERTLGQKPSDAFPKQSLRSPMPPGSGIEPEADMRL